MSKYIPTDKHDAVIICEQCGMPVIIVEGWRGWSRKRYCNNACKQRCYRQRKADGVSVEISAPARENGS